MTFRVDTDSMEVKMLLLEIYIAFIFIKVYTELYRVSHSLPNPAFL